MYPAHFISLSSLTDAFSLNFFISLRFIFLFYTLLSFYPFSFSFPFITTFIFLTQGFLSSLLSFFYPFSLWRLFPHPCLMAQDVLRVITQGALYP